MDNKNNSTLELIKQMIGDGVISQETAEKYVPELKDIKDEKIRKGLIEHLKELKEQSVEGSHLKRPEHYDAWIAYLEKQGEQNIEEDSNPKYHTGNWIISDTANEDYRICLIMGIYNGNYITRSIHGYHGIFKFNNIESMYRLWTIKDAKSGDLLADADGLNLVLFRGIGNNKWNDVVDYHATLDRYDVFGIQEDNHFWGYPCSCNLFPATKEQCERFVKAMNKAGYEWDADALEVRKIDKKPAWSEEDERLIEEAAECLRKYASKVQGGNSKVYVLSLADRIESLKPQNT